MPWPLGQNRLMSGRAMSDPSPPPPAPTGWRGLVARATLATLPATLNVSPRPMASIGLGPATVT